MSYALCDWMKPCAFGARGPQAFRGPCAHNSPHKPSALAEDLVSGISKVCFVAELGGGTFLLSNTLPGENKGVVLFSPLSSGYALSSTMGAHRKPLNVQLVRIRLVSCKWRKWRLWSWKWSDEIQNSYLTKAAFQTLSFALAPLSWNLELPRNTVLMTGIWLSQH